MRSRIGAVVLCALVIAASACDRDDNSTTPPQPSSRATQGVAVPTFDPPLAFDSKFVTVLPAGDREYTDRDYDVSAQTIYTVTQGNALAASLTTGRVLWRRPLQGIVTGSPMSTAPKVAQVGGKAILFVAYLAVLQGSGTTADRRAVIVYALDARDGTVVWQSSIDDRNVVPQSLELGEVGVAGANDKHVVVSTAPSKALRNQPADFTAVLDAATGGTRWTRRNFYAVSVDRDAVVGVDGEQYSAVLMAKSAGSGKTTWTRKDLILSTKDRVSHLAPGVVTVVGGRTLIVASQSGTTVVNTGDYFHSCVHDQRSVAVCSTITFPHLIAAWDTGTGKKLWGLPDRSANRIAPEVTAAWHGVVYGETERGPIILDIRTGKDKVDRVAFAPDRVVAGYGIGVGGLVTAFAATR